MKSIQEFVNLYKGKGYNVAVLRLKERRKVIKYVESKIENVQDIEEERFSVMLEREGKYGISHSSRLEFNGELSPGKIVPVLSQGGELRKEKERVPVQVVELESRYPTYGTLVGVQVERELITSNGFHGLDKDGYTYGYFRVKNGDYSGSWAFSDVNFSKKKVEETVRMAEHFASFQGRAEIEDGEYQVVLSPQAVGNLMMYVANMASKFSILAGTSMFRERGETMGNENITLMDTPCEDRPMSAEFDDEGTHTFNKEVISKGIFINPLSNNELGETTGNAGWINPRPWNLEVKEGDSSLESMLTGNVVFINNVWYTRFNNYSEGIFSTVSRDAVMVYKGGKFVGIAGRVRIADSLKKILSPNAVSKERYSVMWWDAKLQGVYPYLSVNVRLIR